MIICPKPLVADRKWENEMKRFDEEFTPLDGDTLRQIISDTDRDGEWPTRYGKVIVPYSILDARTYQGNQSKRHKSFGLQQLDPAPHFDLVIIDEAHHLRNGSMEKDKAFAYKCVHYFCQHADAVVMLTATPLQTSDDDLYTLLNLLRPDVVIDKKSFTMMSRPNPYISQCAHIVRAAKENWKAEALETLDSVLTTQWGENVIANNPVFEQIRKVLRQDTITREERVKLITDIESLHSFNMMLNRTRRKDIQDFCIRRTHTLESDFTDQQRELHDALLTFEVAALSKLHGGRGVKFMMSTIRRQAASCIFGLAPHIRAIINRRFEQMTDDPEFDFDEMDEIQANQMIEVAIDQYYIQQDKNGMLLFMEVMVTRMQQAGEVVVPYITENPFMSEEQISKVKAGDTISLDHDVRLKIETVKDADEKEWIGVFTSSEEMHKGSAGNVQMNQSIESILRLALNWEQVNGIVINPFGKYIQMTKKMIELLINGYEHYENERKSKDDENN